MQNVAKELRQGLISLGDEKGWEVSKLKTFYGRVEDSLEDLRQEIAGTLFDCVKQLPHKMNIYASFIALIHNQGKQQLLVNQLFQKTMLSMQIALDGGHFSEVVTILRFLAELVNVKVLHEEEFFQMLTKILDKYGYEAVKKKYEGAATSSTSEFPTVAEKEKLMRKAAQFPAYACLLSIPFLSTMMQERCAEHIEKLLATVEPLIAREKSLDEIYCPIRDESQNIATTNAGDGTAGTAAANGDGATDQNGEGKQENFCSRLEFLYTMIKNKKTDSKVIRRQLIDYEKLKKAVPHRGLPGIPENSNPSKDIFTSRNLEYNMPYFLPMKTIFDNDKISFSEIAGDSGHSEFLRTLDFQKCVSDVDQFFIEIYVTDVMRNFNADSVLCAKQLLKTQLLADANHMDNVLVWILIQQSCFSFTPEFIPLFYQKLLEVILELQFSCLEILQDMVIRLVLRKNLDPEVLEHLASLVSFHCVQGKPVMGEHGKTAASLSERQRILVRLLELDGQTPRVEEFAKEGNSDSEDPTDKPSKKRKIENSKKQKPRRRVGEGFCVDVIGRIVRVSLRNEVWAILNKRLRDYLPPDNKKSQTNRLHNPYVLDDWNQPNSVVCPPCPEYQDISRLITLKDADTEALERLCLKFVGTRKSDRPNINPGGRDFRQIVIMDESTGKQILAPRGYHTKDYERWTKEEVFDMLGHCFHQKSARTPTHAAKALDIWGSVLRRFQQSKKMAGLTASIWRYNPVRLEYTMENLYVHKIASAAQLCNQLPILDIRSQHVYSVYNSAAADSSSDDDFNSSTIANTVNPRSVYNVIDSVLGRVTEQLFFLMRAKEQGLGDQTNNNEELEITYRNFQEAVLCVIKTISKADESIRTDTFKKFFRKYAGPRGLLVKHFVDKISETCDNPVWDNLLRSMLLH